MKTDAPVPLANVLDLVLDAVCVVDAEGRFLYVSAAFERIFGYAPVEVLGRAMFDLVHPEDRPRTQRVVDHIMAGSAQPHFENRWVHKDGHSVHVMWSARWSEADGVRIAVGRDISERKRQEAVQAALYAISEAAHTAGNIESLCRSIHHVIRDLLPADNCFVALRGSDGAELGFVYHVDERIAAPLPAGLDANTLSAGVILRERPLRLSADAAVVGMGRSYRDVGPGASDWLGVPLTGSGGVIGALVIQSYVDGVRYGSRDVELLQLVSLQVATAIERKQMQTRLQHIALHDQLTDLPNRELFLDRLRTALAQARRDVGGLALLYLDLDLFKQVNDSFGHAAGDRLLREVADRLRTCVRESDTLGRIGGDEFLVLLSGILQAEHALQIAAKIRDALAQPFTIEGNRLTISPSVGVAIYPGHGEDHRQLIRSADEAMYAAKRAGGNRIRLALVNASPPA